MKQYGVDARRFQGVERVMTHLYERGDHKSIWPVLGLVPPNPALAVFTHAPSEAPAGETSLKLPSDESPTTRIACREPLRPTERDATEPSTS